MAQPLEIFGDIKGMTRDFAVDSLPSGYLWNLVDAIPARKGSRVDMRGGWVYHGPSVGYGGTIWGGYYAAFVKGQKLLVVANSQIEDVNLTSGAITSVGAAPATMLQNGVKLHDKVYFFDGAGLIVPKEVSYNGTTVSVAALPASAPKAKVGCAYRQRLVVGGDPANPQRISFAPVIDDGGPSGTWDTAEAWIDTNNEVTGLAPMAGQILVFHPAAIERIRGTVPPGVDIDDDMFAETLTDQVGCVQPQTIVPWRENIIFADERGVFMTDGSTIRNLIELGGMGDFWRQAYGYRILNAPSVSCGTFLDYLLVNVICLINSATVSFTLVCDLGTRSWFRFRNFPATCYIPSESATEEAFCGNYTTNKLMKTSTMFQDPLPLTLPPPDYVDGDGSPVYLRLATGFKRLSKEEGLKRIRSIFVSYHHESATRTPIASEGMKVEYLVDPPHPEENDPVTGDPTGWIEAGRLPDAVEYTRKKLPVGRRGYGLMVRLTGISSARTSRFFSIGVETTDQDRGKVTT
jgi:hypothetical protein